VLTVSVMALVLGAAAEKQAQDPGAVAADLGTL
jgi:hypothetical protein